MLRSMQKADLVIFISQFARQVIQRNLTKSLNETILIPHGVDFNELSALNDINHIITEPYILYPSSLDNYKSQLEVVEAYSILSKKRDLPDLVLVGSHDQNRNYFNLVKDKILNTGLEEKVILTGKIDYELMPSIYRKSEMVIFASQTENCPNILLEAMSSNKFILCSNIQPMPEFAKDTVIYFNPKVPKELANKLDWALDNPQVTEHFASMAFEESKNYSWKTTSIKTWDSLNSII